MTLPVERRRAVRATEAFLASLLDPRQTPKVPKAIRRQALALLRHYPDQWNTPPADAFTFWYRGQEA